MLQTNAMVVLTTVTQLTAATVQMMSTKTVQLARIVQMCSHTALNAAMDLLVQVAQMEAITQTIATVLAMSTSILQWQMIISVLRAVTTLRTAPSVLMLPLAQTVPIRWSAALSQHVIAQLDSTRTRGLAQHVQTFMLTVLLAMMTELALLALE